MKELFLISYFHIRCGCSLSYNTGDLFQTKNSGEIYAQKRLHLSRCINSDSMTVQWSHTNKHVQGLYDGR